MALITGTPLGTINQQDDIYFDTAPTIFFQERDGTSPLNNPDGDGFYWGLTGSTAKPVYELGCIENVTWGSDIALTDVRCDTVGNKVTIQKVNHLDLTFDLKTLLPLTTLRWILRGGAVTTNAGATEKMGIGQPNNQKYFRVYFPLVYDEDAGDYVSVSGQRCQFVDSWQITYAFGEPATMGVTLRMFADDSLPREQLFATIIRADPSAV